MTMLTYASPRFLLVLAAHENLLRAALVTRDLRIASSAKQSFGVNDGAFDPAEVWYKMKKVIAACFDIGRTQPRELLAGALVGDERAWCVWQDNAGDVDSVGYFFDGTQTTKGARAVPPRFREHDAPVLAGTLRAWLLWNLSGAYVLPAAEFSAWRARAARCKVVLREPRACDDADTNCFGTLRARSPFAEPLPIAAMFSEAELIPGGQGDASSDDLVARAAAAVFEKL
jgi:hypothetical protein